MTPTRLLALAAIPLAVLSIGSLALSSASASKLAVDGGVIQSWTIVVSAPVSSPVAAPAQSFSRPKLLARTNAPSLAGPLAVTSPTRRQSPTDVAPDPSSTVPAAPVPDDEVTPEAVPPEESSELPATPEPSASAPEAPVPAPSTTS